MAKSTGNVVLVPDLTERGLDPLALRLAYLGNRYRTQINLTWDELGAADRTLGRWRGRVRDWAEAPSQPMDPAYAARFRDAVAEDLDTPAALQVLREVERDTSLADGAKFELFAHVDRVLAVDLVRDVGKPRPVELLPEGADELLAARLAARAAKDWTQSDALRDQLSALGVAVTDTAAGQEWQLSP
jgi:cysteinyl-tRNA synthetase